MWSQTYQLFGLSPGSSALVAAFPIVVVLVLLGVFRRPAWIAAVSGLAATFLLACVAFGMPIPLAVAAAGYGVGFGLFPISWIVFSALLLFRISTETGQFHILRDSIGGLTADPRLQALLIAFAFGAFLEGAAGFGTPVAIAAAMLTGLGFSPFRAAAICLLANTAPVAFGSIGIPIVTLAGTTGLPLLRLSAAVGKICAPVALLLPAYLILAIGGWRSLRSVWLPACLAGGVYAVVQTVVSSYFGPQLTDILAAIAAVAVLILYLRFSRGKVCDKAEAERFRGEGGRASASADVVAHTTSDVVRAWMPYGLLVVTVLLWGVRPIHDFLERATVVFPWPMLHDQVVRLAPVVTKASPYHAFYTLNTLSAAGTACFVAALASAALLGVSAKRLVACIATVLKQMSLPTLTVTAVLAMAFLMNYSGATATLGIAFAATGVVFPFFSAILGWIGVFLTGSDTSANALFGNLQVVTAEHLGLNPVWTAAANSVGGVMGKMISLQTIAVAAAATGMSTADQSRLFRFTLRHSVLLAVLTGCIALVCTYYLAA